MDASTIKQELQNLLHATGIDQINKSFNIGDFKFNFTETLDSDSYCLDITPANPDTSIATIINTVFNDVKVDFPLLESLVSKALADINLDSIEFSLPTQTDQLGPVITLKTSLATDLKFFSIDKDNFALNAGASFAFTNYVSKTSSKAIQCSQINLSGEISFPGLESPLSANISSQDSTTWQLQIASQQNNLLAIVDNLASALPNPVANAIDDITTGFNKVGMGNLAANSLILAVDFNDLKLLNLEIDGNVTLGNNQGSTTGSTSSQGSTTGSTASLDVKICLPQKTVTGQLTSPATLELSSFIPDCSSKAFEMLFPAFYFSLDFTQDIFQVNGSVQVVSSNSVVKSLTQALGLYSSGNDDNGLAMSLYINTGETSQFSFSCGPTDSEQSSCSIEDLVASINSTAAKDLSILDSLPKLSLPQLQINYSSGGDFDISLASLVGDHGEIFLDVDKQSGTGTGLSFGIAFSDVTNFNQIVGINSPLPLPACLAIDTAYLVFSISGKAFSFPNMGSAISFDSPDASITEPNFAIGLAMGFIDTPGTNENLILSRLFGKSTNVFANGAIKVSPSLSFCIDAGVECDAKLQLSNTSDKGKCFAVGLDKVDLLLTFGESGFSLSFNITFDFTIESQDIYFNTSLSLLPNEVDISGTMLGVLDKDKADAYEPVKITLYDNYQVELSNWAVLIGDSYELEEPAVGFTGEVTLCDYNLMLALLIDIGDPQNFMGAASLSATNLSEIVSRLCSNAGDTATNPALKAISNAKVTIEGTSIDNTAVFTDVGSVINQLDNFTLPDQVTAILTKYDSNIDSKKLVVSSGKKHTTDGTDTSATNDTWFVTDTQSAKIYQLTLNEKNEIEVDNEIQFYLVPNGTVNIGKAQFNQGFRIDGALKVYEFCAGIHADLDTSGLSFKAMCTPVDFPSDSKVLQFRQSATDTANGPWISLDTHASNPYFKVDGYLSLLDANGDIHLDIDESGINGSLALDDASDFSADIAFSTTDWEEFTIEAKIDLDLDVKIPDIKSNGVTIIPGSTISGLKFSYMDYFDDNNTERNSVDYNLKISVGLHNNSIYLRGALLWNKVWIYVFDESLTITLSSVKNIAKDVIALIETHADTIFDSLKHDIDKYWVCFCQKCFDFDRHVIDAMWIAYGDAEKVIKKFKSSILITEQMYSQTLHRFYYKYQQPINTIINICQDDLNKATPTDIMNMIATGPYAFAKNDCEVAINTLHNSYNVSLSECVSLYKNVLHVTKAEDVFNSMKSIYGNDRDTMARLVLILYKSGFGSVKDAYDILVKHMSAKHACKDLAKEAKVLNLNINWKNELGSVWKHIKGWF